MAKRVEPEITNNPIITVGFSPAWDITSYVDDIEWGQHKTISSQMIVPAGKPLNISKALAWMSKKSIIQELAICLGKFIYAQRSSQPIGIGLTIDNKFIAKTIEATINKNSVVSNLKETLFIKLLFSKS